MTYRYSVIVPVEKFNLDLPVLKSLQLAGLDPTRDEILVAEGIYPSRQRNEAVRQSRGEILVFLDADAEVPVDYFKRIEHFFDRSPRTILGGPVLLKEEHSEMEAVAQALFSNPWLLGKSAARYHSLGVLRNTDQSELILCQLVTTRVVWNELLGFDERLYPNEENEWIDRAESKGIQLIYDPALWVRRPQRESYQALFNTFSKYGRGRGEQMVLTRQISWIHLFPALVIPTFCLAVLVFSFDTAYELFSLPFGCYILVVFGTLFWRDLPWQNAFFAAILSPFLLMAYGLGEWHGFWTGFLKQQKSICPIELRSIEVTRVPI